LDGASALCAEKSSRRPDAAPKNRIQARLEEIPAAFFAWVKLE
jgi:hypothetical protein